MCACEIRIGKRPKFMGNYYENFLLSSIFDANFVESDPRIP